MSRYLVSQTEEARTAVHRLFETAPPVLVEVRFPNMATAPDWYLCKDEEDLRGILDRVGPGVELHLNSVWDLKSSRESVRLQK